jgi:asparagine synthase (glutamine-hydrolysing)
MCGIAGMIGPGANLEQVASMVRAQTHRGPDASAVWLSPSAHCALGHDRHAIIDLSPAGKQPFVDQARNRTMVFNGEIYNYRELRTELTDSWRFQTETDTEVLMAAYDRWGAACLDRLIGMFAFAIWDDREQSLFAARDRFGVKPFHFAVDGDQFFFASEIKALFAAGVPSISSAVAWANFLALGAYESENGSFWQDVQSLPAGAWMELRNGRIKTVKWYDVAERVGADFDARSEPEVIEEYRSLLRDSVSLRFRADVPVGINLSGGVDSSVLLGAVHLAQGADSDVKAFTFSCGDPAYDELPWVRCLLEQTRHENVVCVLTPEDVPDLAESMESAQDAPYGGLPTLAYARLFECARERGVIVLLDGQGMDEQWAGYDYFRTSGATTSLVQGTNESPVRPDCLMPEFRALAEAAPMAQPFPDRLRNLQYRDLTRTKLPRALRFNDRVSMRSSTELREPFLDHRLVELALRQPAERKIRDGQGKWLLRRLAAESLPTRLVEAPKRPLQTPQREWLRGPLRDWAHAKIEAALASVGGEWLDANAVRRELSRFQQGESDNSFYVWQWINLAWPVATSRLHAA